MDLSSVIKSTHDAYLAKDRKKMQYFLNKLRQIDLHSPYLKRFEKMLETLPIEHDPQDKNLLWKFKIKWVPIRCPKCGNYLRSTTKFRQHYSDFKTWKISSLNFKCPSCKHTFSPDHTRMFKSLFLENVWVGRSIKIKDKEYDIKSVVQYKWIWKEPWESWWLIYNEYLLVDNLWKMIYLSESRADRQGWSSQEVEISEKIIPSFWISEISDDYILTSFWKIYVSEIDEVGVTKIFWENNKSYQIWERIKLYSFEHAWTKYVLEKESSKDQSEIWVYKTYPADLSWENYWIKPLSKTASFFVSAFIIIMLSIIIHSSSDATFSMFFYGFIFLVFLPFDIMKKYILHAIIASTWMLFWFFLVSGFSYKQKNFDRKEIASKTLEEVKWTYSINFLKWKEPKVNYSTVRYDAGWYRDRFKKFKWMSFKVSSQEDLKLLKYFSEYFSNIVSFKNKYIKDLHKKQSSGFQKDFNLHILRLLDIENLTKK